MTAINLPSCPMKRRLVVVASFLALALTSPSPTMAQIPSTVVTLQSKHGFDATVTRLKAALTAHGLTVFADIDQRAAAAQAGTVLRPTRLLIFGNPAAGTPIMQAHPHAALELPLRAVVWEDDQQRVQVDYQDAARLLPVQYGVDGALTKGLAQVPALLRAALAD